MSDHWALSYIGTPWVAGESDCWHFARRVWAERFGLDVPVLPIEADDPRAVRRGFLGAAERRDWMDIERPEEGDAVLMAKGVHPCHVGIWVAPNGILHSIEGAGAIHTEAPRLRDLGFHVIGFYRRRR